MVDSQGGTYSNTTGASMSGSPRASSSSNALRVGDSLESLGLGGDEACLTTSTAKSQGGNLPNATGESMSSSPTADSNDDVRETFCTSVGRVCSFIVDCKTFVLELSLLF